MVSKKLANVETECGLNRDSHQGKMVCSMVTFWDVIFVGDTRQIAKMLLWVADGKSTG